MKWVSLIAITILFSLLVQTRSDIMAKTGSDDRKTIARLKSQTQKLKEDVVYLQTSIASLDGLQARLNGELRVSERDFSNRFEKVLIPLLHWPQVSLIARTGSWIEMEHLKSVLRSTRDRIIQEPLRLIGDREEKIQQSKSLKEDFADALVALKSKQSLLDLQLEELQMLERRSTRIKKVIKVEPTE